MKRVFWGIFLALLISGSTYAGWNARDNKQDTKNASNQTPTVQTSPKTQDPVQDNHQDTYLVIKEWGVRMKLSNTVKDAQYKYLPELDDISLSTVGIERVQGCQNGAIFGVARAKKGESLGRGIASDTSSDQANPYVKAGDYYYLLTGPAFACASKEDKVGTELLSQVRSGLSDAQRTIEEVSEM